MLYYTIGNNHSYFNTSKSLTYAMIVTGSLILYTGVNLVISKNSFNISLFTSGFIFGQIFSYFGLVQEFVPKLFPESTPKTPEYISSEVPEYTPNPEKCLTIKYGTFLSYTSDTIIRYVEKGKNYEILKSSNGVMKNKVKWIDSCSYMLIGKNGILMATVHIGDFKDDGRHYVNYRAFRKEYISQKFFVKRQAMISPDPS